MWSAAHFLVIYLATMFGSNEGFVEDFSWIKPSHYVWCRVVLRSPLLCRQTGDPWWSGRRAMGAGPVHRRLSLLDVGRWYIHVTPSAQTVCHGWAKTLISVLLMTPSHYCGGLVHGSPWWSGRWHDGPCPTWLGVFLIPLTPRCPIFLHILGCPCDPWTLQIPVPNSKIWCLQSAGFGCLSSRVLRLLICPPLCTGWGLVNLPSSYTSVAWWILVRGQ